MSNSGLILDNKNLIGESQIISRIDPLCFETITCCCGSSVFTEELITKKVPLVYQSTLGTDIIDFRYLVCAKCGELHETFKADKNIEKLLSTVKTKTQ